MLLRVPVLLCLALLLLAPETALAQSYPYCRPGQKPLFLFGFKALADALGEVMGEPIECEHTDPATGDAHQMTTRGLALYRKATNTPTFTNGWEHWALTSRGLVDWTGTSIDPPSSSAQAGTATLRMRTTNTTNEPVVGLSVTLYAQPDFKPFASQTTDRDGRATFTSVPPGDYVLYGENAWVA